MRILRRLLFLSLTLGVPAFATEPQVPDQVVEVCKVVRTAKDWRQRIEVFCDLVSKINRLLETDPVDPAALEKFGLLVTEGGIRELLAARMQLKADGLKALEEDADLYRKYAAACLTVESWALRLWGHDSPPDHNRLSPEELFAKLKPRKMHPSTLASAELNQKKYAEQGKIDQELAKIGGPASELWTELELADGDLAAEYDILMRYRTVLHNSVSEREKADKVLSSIAAVENLKRFLGQATSTLKRYREEPDEATNDRKTRIANLADFVGELNANVERQERSQASEPRGIPKGEDVRDPTDVERYAIERYLSDLEGLLKDRKYSLIANKMARRLPFEKGPAVDAVIEQTMARDAESLLKLIELARKDRSYKIRLNGDALVLWPSGAQASPFSSIQLYWVSDDSTWKFVPGTKYLDQDKKSP